MTRARRVVLLVLALLVVVFVATWLTIPNKSRRVGTQAVDYPARAFAVGLMTKEGRLLCTRFSAGRCVRRYRVNARDVIRRSDIPALERRVKVGFGGAAAVVVLVGLAFGAASRPQSPLNPS